MIEFFFRRTAVLLVLCYIAPLHAKGKLSFGIYAADKPTSVVKKFRPRLNEIQTRLKEAGGEPVRIKMQIASNYARGVAGIIAGRVGFACLGPASYVEVKSRQPDTRILALESNHGRRKFNGVIVVQQQLLEAGLHDDDLSYYEYLGRHDKVGWAVSHGAFDAGALKEATYKKLLEQSAALRVLLTFANVTKPWVARAGMGETTFQRLRGVLLSL